MDEHALNDKTIIPNNDIVFSIIGHKSLLWQQIISYLYNRHKDISEKWKYYNDGKSWLFRTLKKEKTIFWIRVFKGSFKIAFWFGDKAELIIKQSDLSDYIKKDFEVAKKMGNMGRCISIDVTDSKDFNDVIKLIEIKLEIK